MIMEFRKALVSEVDQIWSILEFAIESRRRDGSKQWQDGYPNRSSILQDIERGWAYVIVDDGGILAYGAVILEVEPAYEAIEGAWLSSGPYIVVHRVAASERAKGMGIATHFFNYVAEFALSKEIYSIRVDTNYDNAAMLRILDKLGYRYCGEVYFRGSARRAYEKLLSAK